MFLIWKIHHIINLFLNEVFFIYNIVLISGIQQSNSFIHTHISTFFQMIFCYKLLQNIEYRSLCYTVGPFWLPILNTILIIC